MGGGREGSEIGQGTLREVKEAKEPRGEGAAARAKRSGALEPWQRNR